MVLRRVLIFAVLLVVSSIGAARAAPSDAHAEVRGITISTPTWGWEWGSDAMVGTLEAVRSDGANWIAIHPYARVGADGSVSFRPIDPSAPPAWLDRPLREAHARGLKVMIKPHLAYWGSGFSWRGAVHFDDPRDRERFFSSYRAWITAVAAASRRADAFVVGTELSRLEDEDAAWRAIIADVRQVYPGHLTYAANWDSYARVPFWDALDAIGIQAYFPVVEAGEAITPETLRAGWARILPALRALHRRTGKPIVFTELGYDADPRAAERPWATGGGGVEGQRVQRAALDVALRVIADEPSVRGVFLWKWMPGELPRGDFRLSEPRVRRTIRDVWTSQP